MNDTKRQLDESNQKLQEVNSPHEPSMISIKSKLASKSPSAGISNVKLPQKKRPQSVSCTRPPPNNKKRTDLKLVVPVIKKSQFTRRKVSENP